MSFYFLYIKKFVVCLSSYLPSHCILEVTFVFSCQVWATCLSESERKLLTQFLPTGTGAEQAVQSLLSGEDHHFGNPFLRWQVSLANFCRLRHVCLMSKDCINAYYSIVMVSRINIIEHFVF